MNSHKAVLTDDAIPNIRGDGWSGKVYGVCPQVVRGMYGKHPFIWRIRHGVVEFTIAFDEDEDPVRADPRRCFHRGRFIGADFGFLPQGDVIASVNAYTLELHRSLKDLERKV